MTIPYGLKPMWLAIWPAAQSKCFLVVGKLAIVISSRGQSCKGLWEKAVEVSDRYFIVGGQMASCRQILTGLGLTNKRDFP